ncbi:MAG: ATPase-like protein [Halomonas sp. 54_146]|nr:MULTISPECIES: hypothetical protein [unclassified Halomonas]KUJ86891.1 MAG: ATPase-like protein [Halomonas sp. 54_146]HAA44939.1 hypothetical protein [Halomonas sp.]
MTQTLCITGAFQPELNAISAPLYQAGLAPAASLQRETSISMHTWHQRAKTAFAEDRPLGKLWENVANNLLLANLDKPCWGWHDADSIWAMAFWAEQEPNTHFLLVATRPEVALAQRLQEAKEESELDIPALLTHWQHHHQRLLDFYLANPERCLVVDAEQAQQHPQALAQLLAHRWQLPLDAHGISEPTTAPSQPDALALYLAQQLIEQHLLTQQDKGFQTLHAELQAAQHPLVNNPPEPVQAASLEAIVLHYQQLNNQQQNDQRQLASDAQQIETLTQQIETLAQQRNSQQDEIEAFTKKTDQLSQQLQQAQQALSAAEQQHQIEQSKQQQELDDLKQESELLLLQLHQVQEELESTFLKHQQLESQYQTLQGQQTHSQQQLAQAQERLKQTEQQHQQKSAAQSQQLDAAKKEIQALTQRGQNLSQQLKQAEQQRKQAEQQRDAAKQNETTQRQQQAELEDIKQESELLLLQLHQVQEELEHYFLEYQKLNESHQTLENRWQQLLQRNSSLLDISQMKVREEGGKRHWQAVNAIIGGRQLESLRVATQQHAQGVNIYLPAEYLDTPLKSDVLALEAPLTQANWQQLQQLTSRDWQLVTQLPRLLQLGAQHALPSEKHAELSHYLSGWQQAFTQLPPVLRVNNIELRNEQINPDYEHLWLNLEGMTFGNEVHDRWSVRLASNDPQASHLGNHFKIEIPEQPNEWLSSWFAESQDELGTKWELRFALPEAMDTGVWQQLSKHDQTRLASLVAQLPQLLERVAQHQPALSRPWEQWQQLANSTQRILQQHG